MKIELFLDYFELFGVDGTRAVVPDTCARSSCAAATRSPSGGPTPKQLLIPGV